MQCEKCERELDSNRFNYVDEKCDICYEEDQELVHQFLLAYGIITQDEEVDQ